MHICSERDTVINHLSIYLVDGNTDKALTMLVTKEHFEHFETPEQYAYTSRSTNTSSTQTHKNKHVSWWYKMFNTLY